MTPRAEDQSGTKARVLVVEDNENNRCLVAELLEMFGYENVCAENGEGGVALAQQGDVDIVLMDIHLPGIDGLTAIRLLRRDASTRHLPIIALTALAFEADRCAALEAGADAYMTKPFDAEDLISTIADVLAKSRQSESLQRTTTV